MGNNRGIATRTTIVVAVVLAVLMLGIPSWNVGNNLSPADNAVAVAGDRSLRIGWIEFQAAIGTLNPLLYTMAEEMMVIWPCYSSLLTRDINGVVTGDLASSWSLAPDGVTYHFTMVNNAVFYDKNHPSDVHPVTAQDVIYTYWLIQNSSGNYLQQYFPVVNGKPILERMWQGTDAYDLWIKTSSSYGPFYSALVGMPILPKYLWETQAWNWDNFDTRTGIAPVIGSGPFYYALTGMPSTGVAELDRSPTWYATEQYGWQLHTNKLVVKSETSMDSMLSDYTSGAIDIMMEVSPSQFDALTIGQKFQQSTGFVYEFNMNQMTDANRALWGYIHGTNNQLLLDPIVKLAIGMTVDKTAFVSQVLNGHGTEADSLVPDMNPAHYWYGLQPGENPDRVGRAPVGEEPIPVDIAGARALLVANGWAYDQVGNPAGPTQTPLYKAGGTNPLQFRFWTLDSDPIWNAAATLLVDWAYEAGIDFRTYYDVKNVAFMNSAWSTADYDAWLWDWMFTPGSDVSTDILQVLTTEAIGSWSDVYWSDPTYDALYYESLQTADPVARLALTDEMQRIAYEDMGCQLVAYRKELYAASNLGPDAWQNYGDWNNKWTLLPDQLYPYLYLEVEPGDNPAPQISSFATVYSGDTTHDISMGATATDSQGLLYRWFYGDGTKSDWLSSPNVVKRYTKDGIYKAWLAVKEGTGLDAFVTSRMATVTVIDLSNTAPYNVAISAWPTDPDTGTGVYFNGTAQDANPGDTLSYFWNFGDGTNAYGQNVIHQFSMGAGSYQVVLSVDDGHLGQAARPVNATKLMSVTTNSPPTCAVPDVPSGVYKTVPHNFAITSTDANTRDIMRFTWDWGDGSAKSVTSVAFATHTYSLAKTYTMTVWADDRTGLSGHNVSDTGQVFVGTGTNSAPVITAFSASTQTPGRGFLVTFTGTATDTNSDLCRMTFDFGDGTTGVVWQPATGSTVTITHAYAAPGTYAAYLTAWDGGLSATSSPLVMTVHWTFTLNLTAGWNLMSVPTLGFGYMANSLGLMTGDVVVSWNPATQLYDKTFTVGVSPPFKNFAIAGSTGYWIYCGAAETLYLDGTVPTTPQTLTVTVPSGGGWALVGFNSLSTTKKASNIPAMYSVPSGVSIVASYNAVTKTYQTWTPGSPPFKDFNLLPGSAYWVYFTASGTLTYNP